MKIKVRITAIGLYTLNLQDFQEAWEDQCEQETDWEDGNDYPDMPNSFAAERFQELLEEGGEDLGEVLEGADFDVIIV